MTHPHDLSLKPLARRALLALPGGVGQAVGVFSGSVWITEEGEPEDHVLTAGESLPLRRPGLVLVEGLQDSQLIVFETGAPPWVEPAAPSGGRGRAQDANGVALEDTRTLRLDRLEREARELRRQAIRATVAQVVRAARQALAHAVRPPATLPPALPRPHPPRVRPA